MYTLLSHPAPACCVRCACAQGGLCAGAPAHLLLRDWRQDLLHCPAAGAAAAALSGVHGCAQRQACLLCSMERASGLQLPWTHVVSRQSSAGLRGGSTVWTLAAQASARQLSAARAVQLSAGTFGALAVMTVISVGLGRVLHLLDEVRGRLLHTAGQGCLCGKYLRASASSVTAFTLLLPCRV